MERVERDDTAGAGFRWRALDALFLGTLILQIILGAYYIFVSSTTIAEQLTGNPLFYLQQHLVFLALSSVLALWVIRSPTTERIAANWLKCGLVAGWLQVLPVIPFLGIEALGVRRWVDLGPITANLTPLSIVLMIVYFAGLISKYRPGHALNAKALGLDLTPLALFVIPTYFQPDSGAILVLATTLFIMLLHAGRYRLGGTLLGLVITACFIYSLISPYGWQRLTQFLDPFADPYNTGYQLSVALSAIGGGGWSGVGVGESVIKPFVPGAQNGGRSSF